MIEILGQATQQAAQAGDSFLGLVQAFGLPTAALIVIITWSAKRFATLDDFCRGELMTQGKATTSALTSATEAIQGNTVAMHRMANIAEKCEKK